MRYRTLAAVALAAGAGLLTSTACVSKSVFRDNVAQTESRIESVEDAVEANERRVQDLRSETDARLGEVSGKAGRAEQIGQSAMQRADDAMSSADRAARGKLLWTVTLTDDRVKFPLNKAEITTDAATALDAVAQRVKDMNRGVYLEIEGHTDSTGGDEFNHQLAESRAMAVRSYLNEKGGIPLHAMNTISYGESRPVADNSTKDGRAQNRRVVIRVLE